MSGASRPSAHGASMSVVSDLHTPPPRQTTGMASHFKHLIDLGLALSSERDIDRLLERFVLGAKEITNGDGATIFLLENDGLTFQIMRNDTWGVAMGGTTGKSTPFPPVPLARD